MESRYAKILLLVVAIFISFFLFLIVLLVGYFLFFHTAGPSPTSKESSSPTNHYEVMNIGSSDFSTSYGSAYMKRDLGPNQLLSYPSSERTDRTIFIKKFGGTSFTCTGSCSCVTSRRATAVLTRGLTVLFSALSVGVASKVAKETFTQHCESKFSSSCPNGNIDVQIEKCDAETEDEDRAKRIEDLEERLRALEDAINDRIDGFTEDKDEVEEAAKVDSADNEEFDCFGGCVENSFLLRAKKTVKANRDKINKWQEENGKCEEMQFRQRIKLSGETLKLVNSKVVVVPDLEEEVLDKVFVPMHLKDYCTQASLLPKSKSGACKSPNKAERANVKVRCMWRKKQFI